MVTSRITQKVVPIHIDNGEYIVQVPQNIDCKRISAPYPWIRLYWHTDASPSHFLDDGVDQRQRQAVEFDQATLLQGIKKGTPCYESAEGRLYFVDTS
jgi:hypothetical protein